MKKISLFLITSIALLISSKIVTVRSALPRRTDVVGDGPVLASTPSASHASEGFIEVEAWQKAHRSMLESFVRGDREGEELLRFHTDHAKYAKLAREGFIFPPDVDPSQIMRDPPSSFGAGVRDFLVVVSTPEERARHGHRVYSPFEFDPDKNVMYVVAPDLMTTLWGPATLVHEISHAYDINTGIVSPTAQGREWLMSEYRAYVVEFRLLDGATSGQWSLALNTILDRIEPAPGSETMQVDLGPLAYAFAQQRFSTIFSEYDASACSGSAEIGVNFLHADREHLPLEWKLKVIASIRLSHN